MKKKRVYVESSVISWLTARPPSDFLKLARQRQTQVLWERRDRWAFYISPTVLREIERGNPVAARQRVLAVEGLPRLPEPPVARRLSAHLLAAGAVPTKAVDDAAHVAIAAVNGMDYLATWNQKHLVNREILERLYRTIWDAGYTPPLLVRPDMLLEAADGA